MKTFSFLLFIMFSSSVVSGQPKIPYLKPSSCVLQFDSTRNRSYYHYLPPEHMPDYRGGSDTLISIIRKNLKFPLHGEGCIEGTIYLSFIIEPDGKLTGIKVVRGIPGDNLDRFKKEAMRVTEYLTDWIPGQCNGENVAAEFYLPIKFVLR